MFECLEIAHDAVQHIGPIVRTLVRLDPNLADQLKRAATSVVSNIAEGAGLAGARRVQHYRYAAGSAREASSQLRVALAWGHVDAATIAAPLALLDRVAAILWRLTR
jgi:four helix bundle protein